MNLFKILVFLSAVFIGSHANGQVLNFHLSLKDSVYKGTVEPSYFDSLIVYPSNNPQHLLLNSHGVLYNAEHGNFEFGIVENNLDDSSDLLIKVSFGWFPLTNISTKNESLSFSWDWDYRPAPNWSDIAILKRTGELLQDEESWNKNDDRECDDDKENKKWSLYCALYQASVDVMGDFNHRNAAMEMVRATIEEITPNKQYRHRLMDFNNQNSFNEIKELLSKSIEKLEAILAYQ